MALRDAQCCGRIKGLRRAKTKGTTHGTPVLTINLCSRPDLGMFLIGAYRGANSRRRRRQYSVATGRDDSSAENARLPR
jgi:hypothetical protein